MLASFEKETKNNSHLFAPHQLRVIQEKEELSEKILKLEAFANSKEFRNLDTVEQGLLTTQAYYMRQYEHILKERIEWFLNNIKETQ